MGGTRTLALVISTERERGDFDTAYALARAARDCGVEVGMFFMANAVAGLVGERARLAALVEDDVDLIACAHSAHQLGLTEDQADHLIRAGHIPTFRLGKRRCSRRSTLQQWLDEKMPAT